MISRKLASKLPKLSKAQQRAIEIGRTGDDTIHDTVEVINTLTVIMIGAQIEPGRDREQWTRRKIRDLLAARELKRYRTYEILRSAQLKPSAFDWLKYYLDKWELTKSADGSKHLHAGQLVEVDYDMKVVANV